MWKIENQHTGMVELSQWSHAVAVYIYFLNWFSIYCSILLNLVYQIGIRFASQFNLIEYYNLIDLIEYYDLIDLIEYYAPLGQLQMLGFVS